MPGPEVIRRNFRQYDRDAGEPGIRVCTSETTSLTVVANRAYFIRFVPTRPMNVTLIGFTVNTVAGANDNCDVGLYDAALNRLVSAGATAGKLNALGVQTVAITATQLAAGTVYYAAYSTGTLGGAAATLAAEVRGTSAWKAFGASAPQLLGDFKDTAHPLPNPLTAGGGVSTLPALIVRES